MKKILVIVGPTASGKSDLAVKIAKKFNGEIISADSRQVYKGLNIGTGKITKKEMGGIKHHLLDVADPKKQFSVSDYRMLTIPTIVSIVDKGKLPIIVGGTGFYIDAVTGRASFPEVPQNKVLRSKLNKFDKEKLFLMLKKKDPERAKTIDPYNKVRLIRALEIIESLGKVPTKDILMFSRTPEYKFLYIGLKPDDLEDRIYKRLIKRMPSMIRETKRLHKNGLSWKRMYELGLEYRFASLYLQKKLTKPEMIEKLNIAIRQYSKRQMTWFKRNKEIIWFKLTETDKIWKKIQTILKS